MLSNIRGTIVSFLWYCERAGLETCPTTGLYIPKSAPTTGKGILQPDALKTLFAASVLRYINAWFLMVVTGLRLGEVYGLQRNDIKNVILTVSRSINASGRITEGKNKNAWRQIVLHRIALAIVEDQMDKTRSLKSEWLFCSTVGEKPYPGVIYTSWKRFRATQRIAVPPYSLHHTFVSMVKNDMPAEMVKAIVGHSASMDTFGVYGHAIDGEKQQAKKIMDIRFERILKTDSAESK